MIVYQEKELLSWRKSGKKSHILKYINNNFLVREFSEFFSDHEVVDTRMQLHTLNDSIAFLKKYNYKNLDVFIPFRYTTRFLTAQLHLCFIFIFIYA